MRTRNGRLWYDVFHQIHSQDFLRTQEYHLSTTMTDVINGKFDDVIGSYRIIDSKYS
jgi:hypothetical protein